jgi:hypothetical protein
VKKGVWPKAWAGFLGFPYTNLTAWLAYLNGTPSALTVYTAQALLLWDQYGWWNYESPGTGNIELTDWWVWLNTTGAFNGTLY